MTTITERNTLKSKIKKYEGHYEHLYSDLSGGLTIGEGHLVENLIAAQKLDFRHKSDGRKATKNEIKDEYNAVLQLYHSSKLNAQNTGERFNLAATGYSDVTKLKLFPAYINELTDKHIQNFEYDLKNLYGAVKFNNFPTDVRLAVFDMSFNLGITKLRTLFPTFNRYILAKNWSGAARESHRKDIAEERNVYVHDLLKKSARSEKVKKLAELARKAQLAKKAQLAREKAKRLARLSRISPIL